MTALSEKPKPRPLVKQIRAQLRSAASREPQSMQPFIEGLDRQLRNYAKGNTEDRAALRPQIAGSIKRIEKQRASSDVA